MPSRIVREGIISSPRVNRLTFGAELLYRRLMSVADDYGRFHASPVTIRAACWPFCPEKVSESQIKKWLTECLQGDSPLISEYTAQGGRYLIINDFGQQIRTKSKFPNPDNDLISGCNQSAQPSRSRISESYSDAESNAQSEAQVPSVRAVAPFIKQALRAADLNGQTSQKFEDFWTRYPRKQHRDAACMEWLSVVTVESEPQVFGCLSRYLASDEVSRGAVQNPEKWLMEQHRDGWAGDWPKANGTAPKSAKDAQMERLLAKAREEDRKNGIAYEGD